MAKTVVILGGAFGGLHVAHYLLKNSDVKVVLVSKSSHFFWNLASVRAIIPGTFTDEQLFVSLADALGHYPADRSELVVGAATAVDPEAKTVTVATAGEGAQEKTLSYDQLVLATGSRCRIPAAVDAASPADVFAPWKADGTFEEYQALLKTTRDRVAGAKHIVVAGAGATGVETAAELGYAFGNGDKEVVLLSAQDKVMAADPALSGPSLAALKKLHVSVRLGSAVKSARRLPDGRTELTSNDAAAEPLITDVYLACTGNIPNSDFLPPALRSGPGGLVAIDACFRAEGVASQDVWALGDLVCKPKASFFLTQLQAAGVGKNIVLALAGKAPQPVKGVPVDVTILSTGPSAGVGRMGPLRLPSFAIWLAKSRTLGTQRIRGYADGSVA